MKVATKAVILLGNVYFIQNDVTSESCAYNDMPKKLVLLIGSCFCFSRISVRNEPFSCRSTLIPEKLLRFPHALQPKLY